MQKYFLLCFIFSICLVETVFSLSISVQDANTIGEKIWKNECAGTLDGLTTWKTDENFAPLGIGHFIWYAKDKQERFQETFPVLLVFMHQEGAPLPA